MARTWAPVIALMCGMTSAVAQTAFPACRLDQVRFQEIDGTRSLRVTGYGQRVQFVCPDGHTIRPEQVFTRTPPDAFECRDYGDTYFRVVVDGAEVIIRKVTVASVPCCYEHSYTPQSFRRQVPKGVKWQRREEFPVVTEYHPEGYFWLVENRPWPADRGPLRETRWIPAHCDS